VIAVGSTTKSLVYCPQIVAHKERKINPSSDVLLA
jgi:hypothetical protein